MMITYLEQLETLAKRNDIVLRKAFRKAGIQDSTYHRLIKKETHLREDTARKVWEWIDRSKE
jgi:hypothetical protein